MKNKAFTLIELLAVIVVLALILIIAIPRILNVIEETEKEAFRMTGENLVKAAGDRQVFDTIGSLEEKTYIIEDGAFVGDSIPMNGKLPDNGTIHISSDGITSIAISDGKWCAMKTGDSDNVIVSKDIDCVLYIPEVVPEICFSVLNNMGELTITDYDNSCSKNVIIPEKLDGLPVRIIGYNAFFNKQLTSVKIPNSVTSIVGSAFYWNQLTSVKIGNNVKTIGPSAFEYNQLTSLTIPSSVTTIGSSAFGVNRLTNVLIQNGIVELNGFDSNQLSSISFPNSVKIIGGFAFENNKFTNLTIPDGITSIEYGAFGYNQLTNITIPTSVTNMGESVFNNNLLPDEKAFIYARNSDGSENKSILISYGGAKRENVIIPNNVLTIDLGAFQNIEITNVTIPNSVTRIGQSAFKNSYLRNVSIGSSVKNIDYEAFYNNQLTNLLLPNSLTDIGYNAFAINQLNNITIPGNVNVGTYSVSISFYNAYNPNKFSGTYTSTSQDGIWTKQP